MGVTLTPGYVAAGNTPAGSEGSACITPSGTTGCARLLTGLAV